MLVAGLDEVGRGSIAGPLLVVAACFETPWKWTEDGPGVAGGVAKAPATPCPIAGVKDSKAFSSRARRAAVAEAIKVAEEFVGQGRGVVSSVDITTRGMGWAIKAAFKRALKTLPQVPDLVLVDGDMPVPDWPGKQFNRSKADVHWWPVSAASVLAKVERDNWMVQLDKAYPGYGWPANAGYGTADHWTALRAKGATPVHRLNFLKNGLTKYDGADESV